MVNEWIVASVIHTAKELESKNTTHDKTSNVEYVAAVKDPSNQIVLVSRVVIETQPANARTYVICWYLLLST